MTIFLGLLAGVISGLLGLGGGIIIVPGLLTIFHWQNVSSEHLMHIATATSLGSISITTPMIVWLHNQRQQVQWSLLRYLIPGTILGALLGVWSSEFLSTTLLRRFFALFCLGLCLNILLKSNFLSFSHSSLKSVWLSFSFSVLIGVLSGLLGIGGGILLVPLLMWMGLTMPQISSTSLACIFPLALSGAITAMFVGWHVPDLPSYTLGFVHWPSALMLGISSLFGAPLGVYLSNQLPISRVKQIFAVILLVVSVRLLLF
ncbi:MAG: sulfite exporter TauE/SafE family protein [Candidatus Berkiellales bacterium]